MGCASDFVIFQKRIICIVAKEQENFQLYSVQRKRNRQTHSSILLKENRVLHLLEPFVIAVEKKNKLLHLFAFLIIHNFPFPRKKKGKNKKR